MSASTASRILIAEDEQRIATFIERGLRAAGMTPTCVGDGISALDLASSGDFDMLVLDVGLPRMDGFAVLRALREIGSSVPVIMVTARTAVEDTVHGLELGADDYVTKPFRFEELLARIRVRLRDAAATSAAATAPSARLLRLGDLTLDMETRIAESGDGERTRTELSAREFALLAVLMRNPGQVLTRETLLSRVWGYDFDGTSNVVDVYVGYLRAKLGNERIATVRGAGYRMVDPDAAAPNGGQRS